MDLASAKSAVKDLFSVLPAQDQASFMEWIHSQSVETILTSNKVTKNGCSEESLQILESIRLDLQDSLPIDCTFDSESITLPKASEVCAGDIRAVQHVDSFVYDEDDLNLACADGKFAQSYCRTCGSKDIDDIDFISHSFSVEQVKFICTHLLPGGSSLPVLLDIGSRTGALLYGATLFGSVKRCIGIEISTDFANLSRRLVDKYSLEESITIINDDILHCADYIQQADVVIMNNVFEFFCNTEQQTRLWRFCLEKIREKPGAVLITVPAVQQSLSSISMEYDLSFLKPRSIEEDINHYLLSNPSKGALSLDTLHRIHMYIVE
ncbi:uncharacterized protein [Watersipora subatra]|uniref:uncharacterized protein n=1 Tax=Watersipora subatra TaxID=2589382 RepID=UPI00355BE8B4